MTTAPRRRQSVRTQLVWWNIFALALLLGALGVVIRTLVRSTILTSVDRELEARTHLMMEPRPGFGQPPAGSPPAGSPPAGSPPASQPRRPVTAPLRPKTSPPAFPTPSSAPSSQTSTGGAARPETNLYRPRVFTLSGRALNRQHVPEPFWDMPAFEAATAGRTLYSTVIVDGKPVRVFSRPFPRTGPILGVIQAPYPMEDINRALHGLDRALLTLLPVALLCAGLGGAFLTSRVLQRVRRLTQAAGKIGARDLSERLPVTGRDEFSDLAETFNGLLGRLETAFGRQQRLIEQQRRFTADASHELKTPLTIIQGNTSLALSGRPDPEEYRQAMAEIGMAADTMSRLVRDLILLAQSDAGRLGQDRIELLLGEVLERAKCSLPRPEAPICLRLEDEALSVLGNEPELVRLFTNLLTNAARHTPPTGRITLAARRETSQVVVTVTDSGEGIAPEHLPHLGERFYRVDSARARMDGGTGLGLSIARSIAEAHGGTVSLTSVLGEGTTVTVTLPAAD